MSNRRIAVILMLLVSLVSLFPAAGIAEPIGGGITEDAGALLDRLTRILNQVGDLLSRAADTLIQVVTSESSALTNNG